MSEKTPIRTFRQFGIKPIQKTPEENPMSQFQAEINKTSQDPNQTISIFIKYIQKLLMSNQSIIEITKTGLKDKFQDKLLNVTDSKLTNELIILVLDNINDERNKKSNPSVFFKLIGNNNLKNLSKEANIYVIDVAISKINAYISCDKNIFFLFLKLLNANFEIFDEKIKNLIFGKILSSLYLYFLELENEKLRKDKEMLMNYISHFKLLGFFINSKAFENCSSGDQENLLEITLNSLFIGSAMEDNVFKSMSKIRNRLLIQKKKNGFYFKENGKRILKRF